MKLNGQAEDFEFSISRVRFPPSLPKLEELSGCGIVAVPCASNAEIRWVQFPSPAQNLLDRHLVADGSGLLKYFYESILKSDFERTSWVRIPPIQPT